MLKLELLWVLLFLSPTADRHICEFINHCRGMSLFTQKANAGLDHDFALATRTLGKQEIVC